MFCSACGKEKQQGSGSFCSHCGKGNGQAGLQAKDFIVSYARWIIIAISAIILVMSLTVSVVSGFGSWTTLGLAQRIDDVTFFAILAIAMPIIIAASAKNKIAAGVLAALGFLGFLLFFSFLQAEIGGVTGGSLLIALAYLGLAIFAFVLVKIEKDRFSEIFSKTATKACKGCSVKIPKTGSDYCFRCK